MVSATAGVRYKCRPSAWLAGSQYQLTAGPANEPEAELVGIADPHSALIEKAKAQAPSGVRFYADYVKMLDEAKPEAVIVTTANNLHLEILRARPRRSAEEPPTETTEQSLRHARLPLLPYFC